MAEPDDETQLASRFREVDDDTVLAVRHQLGEDVDDETRLSARTLDEETVLSARHTTDESTRLSQRTVDESTLLSSRQAEETQLAQRGRRRAGRPSEPDIATPAKPRERTRVTSSTVRGAYDPLKEGIEVTEYEARVAEVAPSSSSYVAPGAHGYLTYNELPHHRYKSQKALGTVLALLGTATAAGLVTLILWLLEVI